MNVVDLIESARPEVAPMPLAERRMVRERLFGAADDVVRTTIRERSQSGAVTSTAPPGYRARRIRSRPRRPRATGSFAKMGAGLLVVGAATAAGWSWWADSGDGDGEALVSSTVAATTTTTSAPTTTTTTVPPTRTGVTTDTPLVFPLGLIPIEEAVIDIAGSDDEFALLRAGDGTWLRLDLISGDVPDFGTLLFEPVGSIEVAPFSFGEGEPWIYVFRSQCGAVRLIDAPGQERLRPVIVELLQGMSIDASGVVDALLPTDVGVVEASAGVDEYRTVFRFERDDGGDADLVTLRQLIGGSAAQVVPGGAQPTEIVWLDEPALGIGDLDTSDEVNGPVTIVWRDASTVFSISSDTVPLAELETFVSGLRAVSFDDWAERFSAGQIDSTATIETGEGEGDEGDEGDDAAAAEPAPVCSPQPALGPTFIP